MGLMLGSDGSRNISVHHNLLAHNHERNPYVKTVGLVDLVNNVFYNPWGTPIVLTDTFGKVTANIINNYFLPGADTEPGKFMVNVTSETNFGIEIYVQGNRSPQQPDETTGDQYAVKPEARIWIVPSQFEAPYITTTSAAAALEQILSSAGAAYGVDQQGYFYWRRDPVDEQVVKDVRNGTGRIINDPSEVGGWPTLSAGIPLVDSDQDGMPDAWELRFGFNPKDPADGNADANGNGYSNVEEYLNGTNPNQ